MFTVVADSIVRVHQIPRGGLPTLTQLLQEGAPTFALSLIAIGGVVWLVAYLIAIRVGIREKIYPIPAVAVCLNITWEIVHSVVYPPPRAIDLATNLGWLALDLVVLVLVFEYGRGRQRVPEIARFWPWVLAAGLVICFLGHVTFHQHVTANSIFPDESGAIPAFVINLVMSVLFVSMYFARSDGAGLSKGLAWSKFIGTGLYAVGNTLILMRIPSIKYAVRIKAPDSKQWLAAGDVGNSTIHPGFLYFLFIGIALFDVVYLWLLYRGPNASRARAATAAVP